MLKDRVNVCVYLFFCDIILFEGDALMFTDTHCHILSDKFYDPLNVIDNLERDNIRRIIINGFNIKSNCEVMDLINNKNVYGALGIHPDNISDFNDNAKNFINENINPIL